MKYKITALLLLFFSLPGLGRGETRVDGATVAAVTELVSSSLVDNFDDGADPNLWGGTLATFASDTSVSVTPVYLGAGALGGTGMLLRLNYSISSAGSWAGCAFNLASGGGSRDISGYKFLSFYIKGGPSALPHGFKIELQNASADPAHNLSVLYLNDYLDGAPGSTFAEVRIPLDAFANLDSLSNVKQINFVFENSYSAANNFATQGRVEIDNLGFGTETPPAIRVDAFGDNWGRNALGGNVGHFAGGEVSTHSFVYNASQFHNAARSLESNYNVTSGFAGIFFIFGGGSDGFTPYPHNFSSRSQLTMWVRGEPATPRPSKIKIELVELVNGIGDVHSVYIPDATSTPAISNVWQKYSIPLTSFTGLNTASIRQMNIVYDAQVGAGNTVGKVYFDEIQFE